MPRRSRPPQLTDIATPNRALHTNDYTVIGIDHDDSDTFNLYVKANSPEEAIPEAWRMIRDGVLNLDPDEVTITYVVEGATGWLVIDDQLDIQAWPRAVN